MPYEGFPGPLQLVKMGWKFLVGMGWTMGSNISDEAGMVAEMIVRNGDPQPALLAWVERSGIPIYLHDHMLNHYNTSPRLIVGPWILERGRFDGESIGLKNHGFGFNPRWGWARDERYSFHTYDPTYDILIAPQ